MTTLLILDIVNRVPVSMDVIRDRTELAKENYNGEIENVYTLKILNMDQHQREYEVTLEGLDGAEIVGNTTAVLVEGEIAELPLRISIDPIDLVKTNIEIFFVVKATDGSDYQARSESRFIGPRI